VANSGAAKPDGQAAMPEGISRQPVVVTARAAAVTALAASPWAPLVAVAGQRQIVLWHADSAECLGILAFPEGTAYSLSFSRQGDLLLAGGGHAAREGCAVVYDVRTGSRLAKVGEEYDAVLTADLDDTHTKIALGGPSRVVRVFSAQTGETLHEIRKHTDWVYGVQFSPDGVLLATCDRSGGLFVWEAETARQYLDLRGHTGAVNGVSWRPDSNVLASCGDDGTIRLWEMNSGTQIKSWGAHAGAVTSVVYAQDGRLVSSGADRTAKLWDGEGNLKTAFPEFGEPALEVAITAEGQRVVAGDWGGAVKMWAVEGAVPVADLAANPAPSN
jgi:WD40 repeat protein